MVSNKEYIRFVNNAVKRGEHDRPIKVLFVNNPPTVNGSVGSASHHRYKKYDEIRIYNKLPATNSERIKVQNQLSKETGKKVVLPTIREAARHELWHVYKPYASEREVRYRLEKKELPRRLPPRIRK